MLKTLEFMVFLAKYVNDDTDMDDLECLAEDVIKKVEEHNKSMALWTGARVIEEATKEDRTEKIVEAMKEARDGS
jgi:hypothetical protein